MLKIRVSRILLVFVIFLITNSSAFSTEPDFFLKYQAKNGQFSNRRYEGFCIYFQATFPTKFYCGIEPFFNDYQRNIQPLENEKCKISDHFLKGSLVPAYPPFENLSNDMPPREFSISSQGELINSSEPFHIDFQVFPQFPVRRFYMWGIQVNENFGSMPRIGGYYSYLGDFKKNEAKQLIESLYWGYDFFFKKYRFGFFGRTIVSFRLLSMDSGFPDFSANISSILVSKIAGLFSYFGFTSNFYFDKKIE